MMVEIFELLLKHIERFSKSKLSLLLFYIVSMILVRIASFSFLVIDHDESTYLEIAREWLAGKTMYKDIIDIKPIGIYCIFGIIQFLGIKTVFGLRLVSSVFLGLGAFLLNRIVFKWSCHGLASLVAGITFVFLHSFDFTLAINTETYFTLLVVFGFYLGFHGIEKEEKLSLFFAGLCIGLAFITKYLALLDGLAFGLIGLIYLKKDKIKSIAYYTLGAIIPFTVVNIFFWTTENWEAFYFITYLAPFKYQESSIYNYNEIIWSLGLFFLPFFSVLPFLFKLEKKILLIISIWLLGSFVAILLPKKPFEHYWIQIFAPISLLFGYGFTVFYHKYKALLFLPLLMLLVGLGVNVNKTNTLFGKNDSTKEVIDYLEAEMRDSETLFCANFEQVSYYILHKNSPTPYIHKSILYTESHQRTLSINGKEELQKILAQKPNYVIINNNYPMAWFQEYVEEHYLLIKNFGEVKVFKLSTSDQSHS